MDLNEKEKLLWVQMLYKYLEKLIEDSKPNRIIDLDNSTFERTALFQICEANNILYTNVEFSRYDSHVIPTYTLGRKPTNILENVIKWF